MSNQILSAAASGHKKEAPTNAGASVFTRGCRLFNQTENITQQELDTTDEQRNTGHNGITERSTETDHHVPDTDVGEFSVYAFVLF